MVLLDSSIGQPRPDHVAERFVEALRRPVSLRNGRVTAISASVGIAVGSRRTVDELLRDADLALYAAKAAGKDRYMLFEAGMEVDEMLPATGPSAMPDDASATSDADDVAVGQLPLRRRAGDAPRMVAQLEGRRAQ